MTENESLDNELKAALFSALKKINPMLKPQDITIEAFEPKRDHQKSGNRHKIEELHRQETGLAISETNGVKINIGGDEIGSENVANVAKLIREHTGLVASHNASNQINFFGSKQTLANAVKSSTFYQDIQKSTTPINTQTP